MNFYEELAKTLKLLRSPLLELSETCIISKNSYRPILKKYDYLDRNKINFRTNFWNEFIDFQCGNVKLPHKQELMVKHFKNKEWIELSGSYRNSDICPLSIKFDPTENIFKIVDKHDGFFSNKIPFDIYNKYNKILSSIEGEVFNVEEFEDNLTYHILSFQGNKSELDIDENSWVHLN